MNKSIFEFEADEPTLQNTHTIWAEKYRPTNLADFVGNETIKAKIQSFIDTKDVSTLLLHGGPGVGKCLDFSELIDIEIELTPDEEIMLQMWKNIE